MGPPDLKKMLTVKLKPRQDTYSDQFSRIIMVKVLMVTATVTGLSWLKDKVTCIIPKDHDTTKDFVSKACWINGMYVYRDLSPAQSSYYYGIPSDITNDGVNEYGTLCSTRGPGQVVNKHCTGLEKTFFLQYQWFPMGVIILTFLYYMPYLLFKFVNRDIEILKSLVKGKKHEDIDYDTIIDKFFKGKTGSRAIWRILANIFVKVLYVVVNVLGLLVIDAALNGEFIGYGASWMTWLNLPSTERHEYKTRPIPKAGNNLLPSFALCQVRSLAADIKVQYHNVHTYICELSQHVLYQYMLIILWFMHVVGIIVSVIGLLKHMFNVIWNDCVPSFEGGDVANLYASLSIRERELMDYIRLKNIPLFGEMMKRIGDMNGLPLSNRHSFDDDEKKPMIPS